MPRFKFVRLGFGLLFIFACPTMASVAQADAVNDLNEMLSGMETLQGEFEQVVRDAEGEVIETSSGTFALKRPGLFRWEVEEPFPQLIVSDQEKLWIYDPDLEQVQVSPFDERLQRTPALLLSGDPAAIRDNFVVEKISAEGQGQRFNLVPKGEENMFERMELVFDDQVVSHLTIYDSLGEETAIEFLNLTANRAIADSTFQFEPPPGVDVLVDD